MKAVDVPLPRGRAVVNVVDWETPLVNGTLCESSGHYLSAWEAPAATVAAHVSVARDVVATVFLCRKCADTIGVEDRNE